MRSVIAFRPASYLSTQSSILFPAHGSGIESSDIDNDLFNDVVRCRPRSNLPRYVHILHRVSETSTCE
jgi:hypothetical protein